MQSTGTKSRKVIHQCNPLKASQVIGTPQQQPPQQQSAVKSQEVTVSAIAAAASVDSAVALSTYKATLSEIINERSVQEWIEIATSKLSQPNPIPEELFLSPRYKKHKRKIALGSFEYTVDEKKNKSVSRRTGGKGRS
jgi:hypothetical protein